MSKVGGLSDLDLSDLIAHFDSEARSNDFANPPQTTPTDFSIRSNPPVQIECCRSRPLAECPVVGRGSVECQFQIGTTVDLLWRTCQIEHWTQHEQWS